MRWLGLLPAGLTLTALASPALPPVGKAIVGAAFVIALVSPAEGLLFAAGLAPLGALVAAAFDISGFRLAEAIILACLAGWLLRGPSGVPVSAGPRASAAMPGPPRVAVRAGWLFSALVVASIAGLAWHLSRTSASLGAVLADVTRAYFQVSDPLGGIESAKLLEGLALFAATIVLFRKRPALAVELPVALAASAVVAATASLLVWRGLGPLSVLQQYERIGYRVAAHVPDVNAAGSYFVLILCLSLGMALRERRSARGGWIVAAVACAIGLWWSESRAAFAAAGTVIPLAALWAIPLKWRPGIRVAAGAVLLAAVVGLVAVRSARLERDPDYRGAGLRIDFITSDLRMIAARPLLGLGAGRFYPESSMFLNPRLAWTYGLENAHNNFLQITAETGLVGITLFGLFVVGGIAVAVRALGRAPDDWRLLGALAGVTAFLVTCLASHPLLVTEVAAAFWIQFGLLVALGSSALLNLDDRRARVSGRASAALALTTVIVAAFVVASVPLRALGQPPRPPASADVDGFYLWETGTDGVRFRWTREYASLFAPPGAGRIEIPVRAPRIPGAKGPRSVEIAAGSNRREFNIDDRWTIITVDVGESSSASGITRINLKVSRGWQGSGGGTAADRLGVQVGQYRITRAPK